MTRVKQTGCYASALIAVLVGLATLVRLTDAHQSERDLVHADMATVFGKQGLPLCYNCWEATIYPQDCTGTDPCVFCVPSGNCPTQAIDYSGLASYQGANWDYENDDFIIVSTDRLCRDYSSCTPQDNAMQYCLNQQECKPSIIEGSNCRRCIRGGFLFSTFKNETKCELCPQ
jgi:hypothetical protein